MLMLCSAFVAVLRIAYPTTHPHFSPLIFALPLTVVFPIESSFYFKQLTEVLLLLLLPLLQLLLLLLLCIYKIVAKK